MPCHDTAINMTDVPFVSARELSVAVKLLALHGTSLEKAHMMPDAALRGVFEAYWGMVNRDAARKSATLVRLQNLIAACASRRMQALLSEHGRLAVTEALNSAASSRLNANYGLNPLKLARDIRGAMADCETSGQAARQAA